jgi:DNA-binding transcriptional LysR family regulator
MIEIRLLRNALALAEYRNFARAAHALNISQPTLTRSIQALETRLGTRLFDRKARTVLPTPTGKEVLKRARLIVASSLALEAEVQQFRGLHQGTLTIGIGPYAASILLGQALGHFNARYPNIRVTAMVDDWVNLPRRLKDREFDFVIMEISELENDADLGVRPLLHHQGFFFCSSTHPALGPEAVSLADLARYPFALPTLPQRILKPFANLFRRDGDRHDMLDSLSIIQSNDVALIRNTVANSQAIGMATYGMLAEELASGRFGALPFQIPEVRTGYGIVTRKGLSLPPAAAELIDSLVEINTLQSVADRQFVEALATEPRGRKRTDARSR